MEEERVADVESCRSDLVRLLIRMRLPVTLRLLYSIVHVFFIQILITAGT